MLQLHRRKNAWVPLLFIPLSRGSALKIDLSFPASTLTSILKMDGSNHIRPCFQSLCAFILRQTGCWKTWSLHSFKGVRRQIFYLETHGKDRGVMFNRAEKKRTSNPRSVVLWMVRWTRFTPKHMRIHLKGRCGVFERRTTAFLKLYWGVCDKWELFLYNLMLSYASHMWCVVKWSPRSSWWWTSHSIFLFLSFFLLSFLPPFPSFLSAPSFFSFFYSENTEDLLS